MNQILRILMRMALSFGTRKAMRSFQNKGNKQFKPDNQPYKRRNGDQSQSEIEFEEGEFDDQIYDENYGEAPAKDYKSFLIWGLLAVVALLVYILFITQK